VGRAFTARLARRKAAPYVLLGIGVWVLGVGICAAQINMPDPSLIHGKAIPAPELPNGTVTVRVVREAIGNNLVGQDVRVTAGGAVRTARTDDQGRAEFTDLPPGSNARAESTVGGEPLVSEPFTVPSSGGLRVILVAGLKAAAARAQSEAAAAAAAPPVQGVVVLGPNSRVLMEFRDDTLQVFYVLDILNNARTRVDIGGPLIIDLPTGAGGASVLAGSSPTATASGDRITVTGPFAPGTTSVQVGFQLRHDRPDLTVRQTWPAPLEQLTVAVEKVGGLSVSSPQFSTVGEVRSETGTLFLLASGPALAAGSVLTLQLSNLPVHSQTPRVAALGLAATIIGVGAWLAFAGRSGGRETRARLVGRRDALLAELAAIERRRRSGGHADEARGRRLLAELERIYGELDEAHARPRGGGEDVAA
ncbi:MAG: hypothetical protein HW394_483, partial [Acidobacteria bacterium]|nr:hypothetical protein [Acidobacteriota bacterium]